MNRKIFSEKLASGGSMKRKLFFYMFILVVFILIILFLILSLLDQFKTPKTELFEIVSLQNDTFEREISVHRNNLAMMGIHFSEDSAAIIDEYLDKRNISFDSLANSETDINRLQDSLFETVKQYLKEVECSGAFMLLDTTVNTDLDDAENSRTGIYLQVNGYEIDHRDYLLYRGIPSVAKDHGVMPHRKWKLEYNRHIFPDYDYALGNSSLPLETAYHFTRLFTLPGTSEKASLLALPVCSSDGTAYGVCGFEISESLFKQMYQQSSSLVHMSALVSDSFNNNIFDNFLSCGTSDNYYYSPQGELAVTPFGKGLYEFSNDTDSFVGVIRNNDGDSAGNKFTTAVMIPKNDYQKAAFGNAVRMGLLLMLIVFSAVFGCLYFTHRFLSPVMKGLEQLRSTKTAQRTDITEINDLLDFLAEKDNETEKTISILQNEMSVSRDELYRLQNEYNTVQREYETAQAEVSRLAYRRKDEVDPDAYQHFLKCLVTLTPKEKEIFSLYLDGKTTREIQQISEINENTLKYHNRNIYSKLGVNSRKQLLMYAALMNKENNDIL